MDWTQLDVDALQRWVQDVAFMHKDDGKLWDDPTTIKAINGFVDRLIVQMEVEKHNQIDKLSDPVDAY